MATFFDDELIEDISVFKCRFCQFKASDPQEVRNHVACSHMTITVKEDLGQEAVATSISSIVGSTEQALPQETKGYNISLNLSLVTDLKVTCKLQSLCTT